jgi:hypothetical protein
MKMSKIAFVTMSVCMLLACEAAAQVEVLVQRYDVFVERKRGVIQKTVKELGSKEGRAIVSAAAAYFGVDPSKMNAGISAAQMLVPGGSEEMRGLIQTPVNYTICYAVPLGPSGAGQHGIETHGDSTFNTTLTRVIPGKSNLDGLGWYMVVPYKSGGARVTGVFDVVWVLANPGWQTKYKCRPTGEHPWLARNNGTALNAKCSVPNLCQ